MYFSLGFNVRILEKLSVQKILSYILSENNILIFLIFIIIIIIIIII